MTPIQLLSLLSALVSILSIYYVILFVILCRKRENISFKLKSGQTCYKCKEDLHDTKYFDEYGDVIKDDDNFVLCLKCLRENRVNQFLEKENSIKYFYGSKKSIRMSTACSILGMILQIIGIWSTPIQFLGSTMLMFNMFLLYKNQLTLSRKRTH